MHISHYCHYLDGNIYFLLIFCNFIIYIDSIMGNTVDKIIEHKAEVLLLGGIVACAYQLGKEKKEKN